MVAVEVVGWADRIGGAGDSELIDRAAVYGDGAGYGSSRAVYGDERDYDDDDGVVDDIAADRRERTESVRLFRGDCGCSA